MTSTKVYDNQFNANEWSVILGLVIGLVLVFVLPRRFPTKVAIIFYMCGVTFGFLFDHVLSVIPVSFYDVNDTSKFQIMDFISYWMYGPVSYLFFYLYDVLITRVKFSSLYVLISAVTVTCIEWFTVQIGIFHYQNGYNIGISFEIYLIVHSIWVLLFYLIKRAWVIESS